jgi:hypothetical protein
MKTNYYFLSLVILCAITLCSPFISCKDDGDTTKPVINLIEPEEDAVLLIGDDVHFEMEVSDDVMLKSYKVNIHPNSDGHTHSRETGSGTWEFDQTWDDISGLKNKLIHHEIAIPAEAPEGPYHLMVYCTDAAGNEAFVARDIELSHEGEEHDHGDEH